MLKIIIVEDEPYKASQIIEILNNLDERVHYDVFSDIKSSVEILKEKQYDLIILDISLPQIFGQKILKFGGINLMNSIYKRSNYKKPKHIIGITKHKDVLEKVTPIFSDKLLAIIEYEEDQIEWELKLIDRLNYLNEVYKGNDSDNLLDGDKHKIKKNEITKVESIINWAKNNLLLSTLIIIGIIIISVGSVTSAVDTITKRVDNYRPSNIAKKNLTEMGVEYSENSFFEKINCNDTVSVKLFLEAGISPNSYNKSGETPLQIATTKNYNELFKILVRNNAIHNQKLNDSILVIHLAIKNNNYEIVKYLINLDNKDLSLIEPELITYCIKHNKYFYFSLFLDVYSKQFSEIYIYNLISSKMELDKNQIKQVQKICLDLKMLKLSKALDRNTKKTEITKN